MACDLPGEPSLRAGARIGLGDRGQTVEIESGVGRVLIVEEPAQPFAHDIGRSAEACGLEFEVPWDRGRLARINERKSGRDARAPRGRRGPWGNNSARRRKARAKAAQIG